MLFPKMLMAAAGAAVLAASLGLGLATKAEGHQTTAGKASCREGLKLTQSDYDGPKRSGPSVHCDLSPRYCSRVVCDQKNCFEEQYVCGWYSCDCTQR